MTAVELPPSNTQSSSSSQIQRGFSRFTLLTDGLLRFEWAPDGQFEDRPSSFAQHRAQPVPDHEIRESDDSLEIITTRFHLTYNKQEFTPYGLFALVFGHTRSLWRFGEHKPWENLGGTARTLDGVDGRIDMGIGIMSQKGYAVMDDSESLLFDDEGFTTSRRPGPGRLDCYLFAYGHDYRAAIKAFYAISGLPPLLPRWSLGNWWSRYYKYTAESYLALVDKFKAIGVPLSVAVLDMDWHLVDDSRVIDAGQTGWTGYTWNKKLFPNPQEFMDEIHRRKLVTTLNEHPADGIHSYEDKYYDVAKWVGHDVSRKEPIQFDLTNRRFVDAYFDILLKALEDDGCDFWWIDWQQGEYSAIRGVDPLWMLNVYHFRHIGRRFPKRRPIIFSRYAGPGSHRYPVGFSGDTIVSWASLEFQPEFTATASNIGYGWWSHDIGGHMFGVKDDELTVRWIQHGVFSPIMRLHSSKSQWMVKEPWRLPREPGDIICDFLRLRHRLIPYLHTMNVRAAKGEPLIQPLYWEYPYRDEAYEIKNQYLFGSELIVMPITSQQDPTIRLAKARGWLPPGNYIDIFTGVAYNGNQTIWFSRSLEQYPVLMKEGSILPLDVELKPENGGENPKGFEVLIAVGANASFEILEEPPLLQDGNGEDIYWIRSVVQFNQAAGILEIRPEIETITTTGESRTNRHWVLQFLGLHQNSYQNFHATVETEGVISKISNVTCSQSSIGLKVDLGSLPSGSTVTFYLGQKDPVFWPTAKGHLTELLESIINNAQINYQLKDAIWEIIKSITKTTASTKMNQLQGLDMNPNLRIALSEYLINLS